MKARRRCAWAGSDPLYVAYHDQEWGVPLHRDRKLFEMLVLEGAQAGLSWLTILRKRENFRRAFAGFDPQAVARFNRVRVARLLTDEGIIRNRAKIESAIRNAKIFLEVREEFGTFDRFLWRFVGGRPVDGRRRSARQIPASSAVSLELSLELKRRGMSFVGPTVCYAFMQAVGMVNDHVVDCFRHREIRASLDRGRA